MWQINPPALISPAPISPFSLAAPANREVCIHLPPNRIILLCNWFICSEGRWQSFGNESLGNRRPRIQPTPCVNFITSVQMNLKGWLCARSLAVCAALKGARFNRGHWCVRFFRFSSSLTLWVVSVFVAAMLSRRGGGHGGVNVTQMKHVKV